jgi:hypothetical protein
MLTYRHRKKFLKLVSIHKDHIDTLITDLGSRKCLVLKISRKKVSYIFFPEAWLE